MDGKTRLDYRIRILTRLSVYAWNMAHVGEPDEIRAGLEIPELTFDGLEDGLAIPEPPFNVGLGVMMNL